MPGLVVVLGLTSFRFLLVPQPTSLFPYFCGPQIGRVNSEMDMHVKRERERERDRERRREGEREGRREGRRDGERRREEREGEIAIQREKSERRVAV